MNIYKNFLPDNVFKKLKNNIMGDCFPWYYNNFIDDRNKKIDTFQFTFTFLRRGEQACWDEWLDIIKPVL